MALADTFTRVTLPLTTARTFWMFGLKRLRVIPVIFLPTPPKYFALPRRTILFPKTVFFPVNTQILDIFLTPIVLYQKSPIEFLKLLLIYLFIERLQAKNPILYHKTAKFLSIIFLILH